MFSDRVHPVLCQYIFTSESSARYCADRYISLYHLHDATYKIIPLKIIDYEKIT